jgi:hypothetical protein
VAWATQLALFLLGAYAIRAHDCHVTLGTLCVYVCVYMVAAATTGRPPPLPTSSLSLSHTHTQYKNKQPTGWILWGLNGQPRPVPHFTLLPTSLLIGGRYVDIIKLYIILY